MIRIYGYDGIYSAIDLPGQTCGLEAADGNGEIHCYRLLDGVTAMRMRLEMNAYTEVRTRTDALEINFCVGGRFETRFSLRDHVLLKPGDMALSAVMTDSMEANLNHGSHWDIMREYALKSIRPPRSDGWNRTRLRFLWIFLR